MQACGEWPEKVYISSISGVSIFVARSRRVKDVFQVAQTLH